MPRPGRSYANEGTSFVGKSTNGRLIAAFLLA
jgi:hypothetical protein